MLRAPVTIPISSDSSRCVHKLAMTHASPDLSRANRSTSTPSPSGNFHRNQDCSLGKRFAVVRTKNFSSESASRWCEPEFFRSKGASQWFEPKFFPYEADSRRFEPTVSCFESASRWFEPKTFSSESVSRRFEPKFFRSEGLRRGSKSFDVHAEALSVVSSDRERARKPSRWSEPERNAPRRPPGWFAPTRALFGGPRTARTKRVPSARRRARFPPSAPSPSSAGRGRNHLDPSREGSGWF